MMKEFKGTKGPWEVVGAGFNEEGTYYTLNIDLISKDNANLIAAAPDLLNSLQQIVSSAYRLGLVSDDDSGLSLEVSKAEFYIAKALGEAK